ncbi:Uncharacterized conserved protein YbaA, DUF1428 family [Thalassolituus maritimus]|uniref:Uncharacterized conserved protein YbaA, DUF1428 family n=1 Tax=Thalassolituus maritimus TaxID=484498 RepID=A0A1N7PMQ2_9GAMM|nr:DUF1428 domain-containing protein [Thalassolituus maritimus]SIT11913.1 Uncharacterized conserved protein YbaA, DUF1428 family [Thalassolituus maritimus]
MAYVDGFVFAVPADRKEIYRVYAAEFGPIFIEHGAESVVECWGDDVPDGEVTSFPMAVKCNDDEVVCFSWVRWPSKAARDEGMKKVFEDTRLSPEMTALPFDGKRMIFGGFEVLTEC